MQSTRPNFISALAIAGGIFFAACLNDPCKDVVCINGVCVERLCECNDGYEGTDCGTAMNAKFSGNYTFTESCTVSLATFPITVTPQSASAAVVTFQGLWAEPQFIANATVGTDGLAFTIKQQSVTTLSDRSISGSGTINADCSTITISYDIWETSTGTKLESCVGNMTK